MSKLGISKPFRPLFFSMSALVLSRPAALSEVALVLSTICSLQIEVHRCSGMELIERKNVWRRCSIHDQLFMDYDNPCSLQKDKKKLM
ncbi:hypothetical protein L6452_08900 [Arctium lappa]|uniref:Uncharacterized protein n=1 Tax=Arctium lappa TaxID=4217 RepID=A0ACB9DJ05_ARCLA|nr:hypothetical protein L6452_08900 [Arctium lappa]